MPRKMVDECCIGYPLLEEEMLALSNSKGGLEWLRVRNQIKAARRGELPPDWFDTVIASGLVEDQIKTWESPDNPDRFGILPTKS